MKTRHSLVSNSSSSSFMILAKDANKTQKYQIKNWRSQAPHYGMDVLEHTSWDIKFSNQKIKFNTDMDGFDMIEFLNHIGIDKSKIKEFDHSNL